MKKIIKTLLVVMVVVLALTAFVACEQEQKVCQHTGGTATCTEAAVCELCGESYGTALGHKEVKLPAIEATCSKEGRTEGSRCSECKETLVPQETIEKLEHVWVANEDRAFTCELDGFTGGNHCENCGVQDGTVVITPAHCVWGEDYVDAEPTCGKAGVLAHDCTVCGKTEKVADIPATGEHSFTVDVPAKEATCLPGYEAHKACEVCGARDPETFVEIPGDDEYGHLFEEENYVVYAEPTCTEDGLLAGYCTHCGNLYGLAVLPAAHKYVDGVCTACGAEEPAHEHTWADATCTAPKTCETCGETEGEALGHDYDNIPHDATCTAAGYVEHICAICDHTYTDGEVEALGHADENGDYKCDRCSTKMLPADGTALTIPQALAIAKMQSHNTYTTQKYYITGIVTNLYNTQYGNFYIKDADGNEICIYGLYDATGKTRYDAMSYKPVEGDEVTVYTVLGAYNTTYQGKNAWLDEVVAHEHDYKAVVTDATCTKGGYTTHTCSICNGYYVDSETEALGHTTESGECERCGQTLGGDTPVYETFTADFNTVTSTNSSYVSSTTTSGWKATNCAVMGGGTTDANPKFKVFGEASTRAFTLNGKTSAKGKLVSPTIADGLSFLSFNYTNCFSESNGVDITITIYQNGEAVATKRLDNNSVTKLTAYTFEWDLAGEGVAVTGDFTIEITNNSPSNNTGNKDRVSIWNLEWTNNPAA